MKNKLYKNNIQNKNTEVAVKCGFNQSNISMNVAGLASEVGETVDIIAKLEGWKKIKSTDNLDNLKEKLELEICDLLVYTCHIANHYDIDIEEAFMKKAEILLNRSFKN
jgi:NTP pyrophosphatase (non-canonical NTP hydrolase)